jgi:hypothetical protein
VLWDLVRFADLVRHDRVSVYQITKEGVARAIEGGLTPAAIKETLNANTGKGLPQNVEHSIDDWARLVKRANIIRATLIEVDDPSVLDEMAASRKTKRYIEKRLSPTVAIVNLPEVTASGRDDAWQKLLKELKGAGYSAQMVEQQDNVSNITSIGDVNRNGSDHRESSNGDKRETTGARKRSVGRVRTESGPGSGEQFGKVGHN